VKRLGALRYRIDDTAVPSGSYSASKFAGSAQGQPILSQDFVRRRTGDEENEKMNKITHIVAVAVVVSMGLIHAAQATIIDHADVAGYGTFQDLNTGRVWLDLDNFFNQSTEQMQAAATAAGFTIAIRSDLDQLLDSLPLTGGEWSTYKSIMGDAPNRELIWGSYDDGGEPSINGYAFAYDSMNYWNIIHGADPINVVQNDGSPAADMNI
jgi:hypothetical protein